MTPEEAILARHRQNAQAEANGQAPGQPQPGEGHDPRPFPLVDLVTLAEAGVKPPEFIADRRLYRGGVHSIAAQPDGGKSTLATWWTLGELRAGRSVVLLDEEAGRELVVEKLLDLGAVPGDLRRLAYVEFPTRAWDQSDLAGLWDLLREVQPSLVWFDSAAPFLAVAGRNENDAADVTAFVTAVLRPIARGFNAAALLLDHYGKADSGGQFSRGSGAKLAAVDVGYVLETITPFNRQQSGLLRLKTGAHGKDRRGYLHPEHEVRVQVENGRLRLDISPVGPSTAAPHLTPAEARVLRALQAAGRGLTNQEIGDAVAVGHKDGLQRNTISEALGKLHEKGLADELEGVGRAGRAKQWISR